MFAHAGDESADRIGLVAISSSSGQPAVEELEDLMGGGGAADCPAGEQVAEEGGRVELHLMTDDLAATAAALEAEEVEIGRLIRTRVGAC